MMAVDTDFGVVLQRHDVRAIRCTAPTDRNYASSAAADLDTVEIAERQTISDAAENFCSFECCVAGEHSVVGNGILAGKRSGDEKIVAKTQSIRRLERQMKTQSRSTAAVTAGRDIHHIGSFQKNQDGVGRR